MLGQEMCSAFAHFFQCGLGFDALEIHLAVELHDLPGHRIRVAEPDGLYSFLQKCNRVLRGVHHLSHGLPPRIALRSRGSLDLLWGLDSWRFPNENAMVPAACRQMQAIRAEGDGLRRHWQCTCFLAGNGVPNVDAGAVTHPKVAG